MKDILNYIKCRFNMYYAPTGAECDTEFIDTLKKYIEEYFSTPLNVLVERKNVEIDMCRFIREYLVISIDTEECYVSNPSVITLEKELRGYTLVCKIRGLDIEKMVRLVQLAQKLVEMQDDINYPLGN